MSEETELKALITTHSHPELAEIDYEMVCQVWEDGEITLQKGGSLLNQRTLHTIDEGHPDHFVNAALFPHINTSGHGFIYTDRKGALAVRYAILSMVTSHV
jgi:hypothetical protein